MFAQQAAAFVGNREVIFAQHTIGGTDSSLQQEYHISNAPCVLMFQWTPPDNLEVVRRLEDVSSRMLEKYTARHAMSTPAN